VEPHLARAVGWTACDARSLDALLQLYRCYLRLKPP
jgi:hypothetical protein